jgi:NIMA (never in mitosis gene a)-related kinase
MGSLFVAGDFGISKVMKQTFDLAETCIATPCYLAPEMCQDNPYSSKADIWVSLKKV